MEDTQKNERRGPKRLVFDVDEELHGQIKARAAFIHIPLRKYITRAILRLMAEEDKVRGKS